ncbi:MAG: addiction module protein [Candidatus Kapaibacterium sp.]
MDRNLDKVMHDALTLDRASRLILAERILSEFEREPEHQALWTNEIHRRIEEIRTGKVETYDAFEVIRETREQLGL